MGRTVTTTTQATLVRHWRGFLASAGTRAFQQAAVLVAALVLGGAIILWQVMANSSRLVSVQVIETLTLEAETLEALTVEDSGGGITAVIKEIARRRDGHPERIYFLESANGMRLSGTLVSWPRDMPRGPAGATFEFLSATGTPMLAVGVARTLPGGHNLLVGRDLAPQRALADTIRWIYLAGFGTLALGGLLAGYGMSRNALRRVAEIARTSDGIQTGDLTRRVALSGSGDELDHIAANLNTMLDRIESLVAAMREVSDNIAHDLKTPLTRLRARAEEALRENTDGHARDGLEQVIDDADEIIKTFNALLLIARLEAGAVEATAERFDLAALVRDVAELYEPVAEEAGVALHCAADNDTPVRANRQLIGQAIANMIDNAIKYGRAGPAPGAVEVDLSITASDVRITVSDRGPGIPTLDRERVLKRFVRLEESRTQPGTGLGLSLVAAVARLHGGHIRLEDNAPGLRIVLVLPSREGGHPLKSISS